MRELAKDVLGAIFSLERKRGHAARLAAIDLIEDTAIAGLYSSKYYDWLSLQRLHMSVLQTCVFRETY